MSVVDIREQHITDMKHYLLTNWRNGCELMTVDPAEAANTSTRSLLTTLPQMEAIHNALRQNPTT